MEAQGATQKPAVQALAQPAATQVDAAEHEVKVQQ